MKKVISLLLFAVFLFSICGCTPQPGKPNDPTEETTRDEADHFKGKPAEEYRLSSLTSETKGVLNNTEIFEDTGFNGVVIQGEDCASSTLIYEAKADDNTDGGAFFYAAREVTDGDFSREYSVTYKVTVPAARRYVFKAVSSMFGSNITTDYVVYVNGVAAASKDTMTELGKKISTSVNRNTNLYPMTFEPILLQAGENEIKFVLDNGDIESQINKKYFLYLDKIEILPLAQTTVEGTVGYAGATTGTLAAQKEAAANINVYTNGDTMNVRLNLTTWATACAGQYTVAIRDYYGKNVFEETLDLGFGAYTYELNVETHPVGFFDLIVLDSAGETIFDKTYVVMNDAKYRDIPEDSPFAVDIAAADTGDQTLAYRYACAAKLAGVPWIRERARWQYIEHPNKGNYATWSTDILRKVSEAGVKQTTLINVQPRWVTDENYFVTEQLAFYNMMKHTAIDLKDVMQAWEIYNEQDWYGFESQSPDLYAAFMKVAALALADSGTGALKILGSLCQPSADTNHLPVYEANGLFDFIDVFNYHNHIDNPSYVKVVTNYSDGIIADEYTAYGNKLTVPTWVTEAGILLYVPRKGEDLSYEQERIQTRYLVNSTVQSLAAGTDKHFWFIYRAGEPEGLAHLTTFRPDLSPRPGVVAEAIMTDVLGSGIYLGQLCTLPEKAEAHLFNNGTDDVACLWTAKDAEITLHVGNNVLKTDLMGNKTVLNADKDGNITFTLTKEPVYLQFNGKAPADLYTPATITPAQAPVAIESFTVGQHVVMTQVWQTPMDFARAKGQAVYEGGTEMKLQIFNFNDVEVSGTVSAQVEGYTVTGDTWDVTVGPMESKELTFTVTPQAGAGKTFLTFNGTFNGSPSSPAASVVLKVN